MYQMKMLSQLGTDRVSDQLLELLEWLFATKNISLDNPLRLNQSKILLQNLSLLSKLCGKQEVQSLLVGI